MRKYLFILLIIFSCSKEASEDIGVEIFQPEPVAAVVKYQLSVTAAEGGTVSTSGGEFVSGSPITVTASPNSGYSFVNWTGDGSSTSSSFTFNLLSNTNLTANFQLIINSYNIVLSAGDGGTVSSEGGEFEEGSEITFSATPNEGFEFVEWSDGNTDIERTITINNNVSISAVFQIIEIKNITLKFNGIGKVWIEAITILDNGYLVGNDEDSGLIISNTNIDDSSTYDISLSPDDLYRFIINYEPFQNELQYNNELEEYWYYADLGGLIGTINNTPGKILEIDYNFSYEEIDLTIKDVATWFHDDIGGPSSYNYGLTLFNQTHRIGAVGKVNCLTKLNLNGQINDQDCFYSDLGPGGWNWQDNNFSWDSQGILTVYSTINKGNQGRWAKLRHYDANFQLLIDRTYRDLQYIQTGAYYDLPILYPRSGFTESYRQYINGNPDVINPGVTAFDRSQFAQLITARFTELTNTGEVSTTKQYVLAYDFLNNYCLGCGMRRLISVNLIGESSGGSTGAYSLNSYFKVNYAKGWVQLGLNRYKFTDWATSSGTGYAGAGYLNFFNGPIVEYDLSQKYRGEVIYTWPLDINNANKIYALSVSGSSIFRVYLNVFNNSQLVYKKLIYTGTGENFNNGTPDYGEMRKFRVYSINQSDVIIVSPYMKSMRIDGL